MNGNINRLLTNIDNVSEIKYYLTDVFNIMSSVKKGHLYLKCAICV